MRSSVDKASTTLVPTYPEAPVTATVSFSAAFFPVVAFRAVFFWVAMGAEVTQTQSLTRLEGVSQQPFGDIPLFRELQKLLATDQGPINTEIAGQVAGAIAAEGTSDGRPDAETAREFDLAVHSAEMLLSGYTRIPVAEPARTELIRRSEWVESTLGSWNWMLEILSGRFTSAAKGMGGEGAQAGMPGAEAIIGQLAPLLLGLQIGTLVGHLSREALGRYDLPIPRDDEGHLFLVDVNAETIASDYGFDLGEFRSWIALRETARHLITAQGTWIERYFRSLLTTLIESIEIDTGDLERRILDMQSGGMEGMEGFGSDQTFPIAATEQHSAALRRLQAFVAIFEGYAGHAVSQVGPQMIKSLPQIEEGMARFGASPSEGKSALNGILGIAPDRALQSAGVTFCAAVVNLRGIEKLNLLWAAPDNLPTLDEVKDPFLWIERVLD
jgi:putative hydrolase